MGEEPRARIFVLAGPDLARSFEIGARAVLGRSDECDVVLQDRSISRKHASLTFQEGHWFLQDLGSTNGVTKDGRRIERVEVEDGDEFRLGELPLRLRTESAEVGRDDQLDFAGPNERVPAPPTASAARTIAPAPAAASSAEPEVEIEFEPELAIPAPRGAPAMPGLAATVYRAPREERRTGLFSGDLEQLPIWMRFALTLVVVAVCAAIAYGAFLAVRMLRGGP
jgi:hypothetical protein